VQPGGVTAARAEMKAFLVQRGVGYLRDISSPLDSATGCSRLSPYLSQGCLSVREVFQITAQRRDERLAMRGRSSSAEAGWTRALDGFLSRLRWHCHFMQKLEDHPAMETTAVNAALDDIRPRELDRAKHDRFIHGMTGFPLVDACVRALHATGWINFRMRAMLVSFYCHDLWMDWRHLAPWLGRHFLDLEAGIHYPQVQMQAGVTGINTLRIYNPDTQARELPGAAAFIRRYVPELAEASDAVLQSPARPPSVDQPWSGVAAARNYPPPMVEHMVAVRAARARFAALHRLEQTRQAFAEVRVKHGSRAMRRPWERGRGARQPAQMEMDLAAAGMESGSGRED
jgi:deoxyribodipyrimidine photo-lyase